MKKIRDALRGKRSSDSQGTPPRQPSLTPLDAYLQFIHRLLRAMEKDNNIHLTETGHDIPFAATAQPLEHQLGVVTSANFHVPNDLAHALRWIVVRSRLGSEQLRMDGFKDFQGGEQDLSGMYEWARRMEMAMGVANLGIEQVLGMLRVIREEERTSAPESGSSNTNRAE